MKYCTCNRRRRNRRLNRRFRYNPCSSRHRKRPRRNPPRALGALGVHPSGSRLGGPNLTRYSGGGPGRPWTLRRGGAERRRIAGPRSGGLRATRGFLDDPIEGRSGIWPRHRPRRVKPKKPETLDDIRLHSDSRFSRGYSGWGRRRRNRRFRYNPCSSDHRRRPRRFNPEFSVPTFKRSGPPPYHEPDVWDRAVEDYEAEWGKGSLGGSRRFQSRV